ncbi:MAG: biopolymer transporter ExbD [Elusimicrobiota bacterium]
MQSTVNKDPIVGINITPLVDVCLVLVIIFMVAAPMFTQPSLDVDLPKAHTDEGKETDNITITITADNKWALNETEMSPQRMPGPLQAKIEESRDKYIIIRADKETPYAYAIQALKMAKAAGGEVFAIATEQKTHQMQP